MFHELLSRDHEDGRATGQPQGVGPEAYLNGTSQEPTPEDARKDGHIRGRSKLFMKHPGYVSVLPEMHKTIPLVSLRAPKRFVLPLFYLRPRPEPACWPRS